MAECPVIRPGESMIAETAGAFKNIAEKYALELCSCCEGLELYGYAPSEGHLDLRQTAWYVLPQTGIMGGRHGT